ncbi:MAG TPA: hypothetical protein VN253_24935 [Kofleriaceae bacterium]|nr:hypothetical protein [Kofleriaceae bacterium]
MTAPADRLAAIGASLARKAPAVVTASVVLLESVEHAIDVAHSGAPPPAPAIIAHVDTADATIPPDAGALLEFLRRLIGWSAERLADVEHAFRAACEMAGERAALALLGEGPLLGVARRLHRLTLPERPFVVLGPRDNATEAIGRAVDGMICVNADAARWRRAGLAQLATVIRGPQARAHLVVSAEQADDLAALVTALPQVATARIPPLAERVNELDRLIEEYGRDAMADLEAPELGFRPHDVRWIRARRARVQTLADLEDVTRRMVALRNWGVTDGAEKLGITHGALSRWARRRRIPT